MYFLSSYGHLVLFDATCGSEDSAGIGLLLQVLLDDKCSLLRAQSKPLFPELSCTICAELSVVPEHFHLCFTSVYTSILCWKIHQVKPVMGKLKQSLCWAFFFKFFQCFSCIMFEPLISLVITDVGSRDLAKKAQVKLFRSLKSPSVKWLHLDLRKWSLHFQVTVWIYHQT